MLVRVRKRQSVKKKLQKAAQVAAVNLLRYAAGLIREPGELPRPTIGPRIDYEETYLGDIVQIVKENLKHDKIEAGRLIMAAIITARLPREDVLQIERWQSAVTAWDKYC